MRAAEMAAAHIGQGSSVTQSRYPGRRSEPAIRQAARITSISAWAVGSLFSRVRLPLLAMILPCASVTTAPTGTSPRSAAARASSSARGICEVKTLMLRCDALHGFWQAVGTYFTSGDRARIHVLSPQGCAKGESR